MIDPIIHPWPLVFLSVLAHVFNNALLRPLRAPRELALNY